MGAERTIVAVGGVHSVSPVTIGADNYTLEAEQGTTVVLNFNGEFAAFADAPNSLWEQSGVYWRTKTGGEFSSGRVQGLYFDGAYAWGIRHEPSDSDNNQTGNDYAGPTVRVNSDGRLYLRFDKPNVAGWTDDWPSYMPGTDGAGNWTVPSQGPNDTRLYLWRQGSGEKAITLNGRTGVHFKDLNFRGRSVMFAMDTGTCSGCTVERCTVYGCTWFVRQTGGTLNTLTVKGCKILHGRLTYYFWNNLKSLGGGGDVNPGGTWDDNACINLNSGGANDWTWEDNLVTGFFDFHVGNDAIEGFTERYNWYEDVLDDHMQTQVDFETWECAYNMFEHASFCGYAETGPSGTRATLGEQYIHNNVVWNRIPRPWIINTRPGPHATIPAHFASGASGRLQPQKFYNNTIIGQTAPKEVNRALRMSHLGGESNNDSSEPHEWYNNIIMMYGDELWNNKDGADRDDVAGGLHLDGFSNEIYDFNHYVRILAYSPASTSFFVNCYDRATRSGGPYDFTSAADLAGDAANQINAEASGTSAESVGVGISNMNTDADNPFEDLEGLDFHVKAGNPAKSGAKNLSATGWPGAGSITAGSERGAYGGGNTQIGPRASVLNY